MSKVDKLIEKSKEHLGDNENVIAVVMGTYETEIMGSSSIRAGIFIATETRIVFYAKKLIGFELESFPYQNISSIEMSKGMLGYSISFFSSGNKSSMKWIQEVDAREKELGGFVEFVRNNMGKSTLKNNTQGSSDIPDQIKKLFDLKDQGILTDIEFTNKKQELLAKL